MEKQWRINSQFNREAVGLLSECCVAKAVCGPGSASSMWALIRGVIELEDQWRPVVWAPHGSNFITTDVNMRLAPSTGASHINTCTTRTHTHKNTRLTYKNKITKHQIYTCSSQVISFPSMQMFQPVCSWGLWAFTNEVIKVNQGGNQYYVAREKQEHSISYSECH